MENSQRTRSHKGYRANVHQNGFVASFVLNKSEGAGKGQIDNFTKNFFASAMDANLPKKKNCFLLLGHFSRYFPK